MRYEIFRAYYLNPVVAIDNSYSFPEKSSGWDPGQFRAAVEKGYVRSAEAPDGFLGYLSVRYKLLWVTSRDNIDAELESVAFDHVATAAYDALGLIHLQQDGQVLVAVALPLEEFDTERSARPTALDGGNARFRVTSDAEEHKGWGYTVHLDRLSRSDKDIRGCRETLLDAVDIRPQGDSAWRLLGQINSCSKRTPASDEAFLNRLLDGRNLSDVISRLEKL